MMVEFYVLYKPEYNIRTNNNNIGIIRVVGLNDY